MLSHDNLTWCGLVVAKRYEFNPVRVCMHACMLVSLVILLLFLEFSHDKLFTVESHGSSND